jgi:hypothetical protein
MLRKRVGAFIAILVLPTVAYSFEVDGFKSGMAFSEARRLVENRSYSQVEIKDGYIGAWDTPSRSTRRDIFLTFCKERLVLLQRYLEPRFEDFVRLVADKNRELGAPLDTMARPHNAESSVKVNAISFLWRAQSDFLVVSYTQFPSNAQLDAVYQTQNSCWATPLFPRDVK